MNIQMTSHGNRVTVSVEGRITSENSMQLDRALQGLDYTDLDLTLDFSRLEYITSAGLRALLVARKKVGEGAMRVIHAKRSVAEVFEASGFSELIPIIPDVPALGMPEDPSFKQILEYRGKAEPEREVFFSGGEAYTWGDADRCAAIIASDLQRLGVHKGSHVAILSKNSVNWILTFFAVQKLGAIVVLLNFSLKPHEVRFYSRLGDITHLCFGDISPAIDREQFANDVRTGDSAIIETYDIHSSIDFRKRYGELPRIKGMFETDFDPDDPSLMLFTSGTTGKPKGVLSSAHDCIANCRGVAQEMGIRPDDRICLFLPLCHIFGFRTGLELSMLYDLPLCLSGSTADEVLLDCIRENRCTIFNSVPTKILSMVQSGSFSSEKVASLRYSMIGGAPISEAQLTELMEKMPHTRFVPIYGMSEITPISMVRLEDTVEHITKTVGRPVGALQVEIRDPATGAVRPAGTEGEIVVKSDTMLVCYYKVDMDKQAIDPDGWLPTGDLGCIDPDGYLRITGRIKELIIRGGENISPNEIAGVISEMDEIADVKVVGIPDVLYGEEIAAAIVMKSGCAFDREAVERHVLSRLARFKAPKYYAVYQSLPLLANGKADMLRLKADMVRRAADPS